MLSIIGEAAEAIRLLSDLVENTRSILKAINDGREYLARSHPGATADFAKLLNQMQTTIKGLAAVTGVLEGFRFTIGSRTANERSLERFNTHVVERRNSVAQLQGNIRQLKADCDQIRKLRDKLNARNKTHDWGALFELVGLKSSRTRYDLAATLSGFYADDQRMIDLIKTTLNLAEQALDDVDRSLGPAGQADPSNVLRAAEMLGIYAGMFRESNRQLHLLADALSDTSSSLERD